MSAGTTRIAVRAEAPYDVVVGTDIADQVGDLLAASVHQVAVIHPPALHAQAAGVMRQLVARGMAVHAVVVPDGESAKTAEVATACWTELGRLGLTRSDAVVGLGGGATTDLAGFVAATYLRGIACALVPTSLLGMVDAAVGGKTGINTTQGKNLVGSFSEPVGVVCDLALLATLPAAELASGLAEVVKCGLIADPDILELVGAEPRAALDPASATLRTLVERAIAVKADVVSRDLREATSVGADVGREALNYGHTMGHAIERVEHYTIRHGDAVAIGLVYVAELARLAGRLSPDEVALHRRLLMGVGLPTSYHADRWSELHAAMRVDKKARGDRIRFVVLEGIGRPAILEAPDESMLAAAYAAISR